MRVGVVHGEFSAWGESFFGMFDIQWMGVSSWDRFPANERLRTIALVQSNFDSLPRLPPSTSQEMATALRQGFKEGSKVGYEAARFMARAVWALGELAKAAVTARAAAPSAIAVGGFRDCAAQTASRAILEMTGVEVSAGHLVRTFGLPRSVLSKYDDAVSFARNYFEALGIKLAARSGGFVEIARGGVPGRYAIFLKGGREGGHVIFGEVSSSGIRVIDDQLQKSWTTLAAAERALGMEATSAYRIESIVVPQ